MAHEQFDRLANIEPAKRSREDRLPVRLLDTVEGWLDGSGADVIAEWSHAYLAHAGGPEARARLADAMVTTNKITAAIRAMARVTEAISAYLLFASGRLNSLMPTAQFDPFEHLDKPLITPERNESTFGLWDQLGKERDQYVDDVETELTGALRADNAAS
jgi:hypothetical protein